MNSNFFATDLRTIDADKLLQCLYKRAIYVFVLLFFFVHLVYAEVLPKPTAEGDTLTEAIEKNQEVVVERLLLQKINIESRGKKYPALSPLRLAIRTGNKPIILLLIKYGANIQEVGINCFALPHVEILELLKQNGVDINNRCLSGEAPLQVAINFGNIKSADYLLANGATQLNEFINKGTIGMGKRTPLQEAARHSKYSVVKWLIEHGADVNGVGSNGLAPLYEAAEGTGTTDIFDLLLKHGAKLTDLEISKVSPMVCYWNLEFLVFLESHGKSPDYDACYKELARRPPKDDRILGWLTSRRKIINLMVREDSLLHIATENNNLEVAKLLLDAGADPNTRGKYGAPPLARALTEKISRQGEYKAIISLLLNRGADPNIQYRDWMTTLLIDIAWAKTIAVSKEKHWEKHCLELLEFAELLIMSGANINATNLNGDTATHSAAKSGNYLMVQMLVARGANLKIQNKEGKTPLIAAFMPSESIDGRSLTTISKLVELERGLGIQQNWSKLAAAANVQIYNDREKKQVINLLKQLESDPFAFHLGKQEEIISKILDESPKTVMERLQSCKKEIALTAAHEIINQSSSLQEPLQMFHPAAVLLQFGENEEAVFWFYAAQLRTRYQLVFEGGDRGQLLAVMMGTIGSEINNYALQDTSKLIEILNKVMDWDKKTFNPYRDRPKSDSTEAQIRKVYAGFDELRAKIFADKINLEKEARASASQQQTMVAMFADRCRK